MGSISSSPMVGITIIIHLEENHLYFLSRSFFLSTSQWISLKAWKDCKILNAPKHTSSLCTCPIEVWKAYTSQRQQTSYLPKHVHCKAFWDKYMLILFVPDANIFSFWNISHNNSLFYKLLPISENMTFVFISAKWTKKQPAVCVTVS